MKFLRLTGDTGCESEYYVDQLSAKYLKGIGDLNIIVGANNSRKSRFMRQVINMPFKLLIDSELDLNSAVHKLEHIFDHVSEDLLQKPLIAFIFLNITNPSEYLSSILSFINGFPNRAISFDIIRGIMASFPLMLENSTSDQEYKNSLDLIKGLRDTVSLSLDIFENSRTNLGYYHPSSSNASPEPGIHYSFPDLRLHEGKIENIDEISALLTSIHDVLRVFAQLTLEPFNNKMILIPALRGARKIVGAELHSYKKTLLEQYKLTENPKLSIETGQDMYDSIAKARNGRRRARLDFAEFEHFMSRIFFEGKQIDIIAMEGASSEKHVNISIDDAHDIPVQHLGDGIQAIMTLMLPIFTAAPKSWVFIDEPELHLHPGFQNIFMNAIVHEDAIKSKELRFFINTHSNHILSESLLSGTNTEIMVFSARDKDSTAISSFSGNEAQTLQLLGVLNTSVLVSNCSVWVEGVTDRLYVRALLHAYQNSDECSARSLSEGLNYSFIEYAGNNLVHYGFGQEARADNEGVEDKINTFFINSNIFVIADTDTDKAEKHKFYMDRQSENFVYFDTKAPEIENILPVEILKAWLKEDIGCIDSDIEKCFVDGYDQCKLGDFFNGKFSLGKGTRKFGSEGKGGTLQTGYKTRLSKFVYDQVMSHRFTWNDLQENKVLRKLAQKLHAFILNKNGGVKS